MSAMSKNRRTKERQNLKLTERPEGSSGLQNQKEATPPDGKRGRLVSLAKKMQQLFPEQYEELAQVIERVEKEKVGSSKRQTIVSMGSVIETIKGHIRAASGGSTMSNIHDEQEEEEKEEEIDPRGREPGQIEDPLIHVFVDHSNILYGFPPKSATPNRERSNTLPSKITPTAGVSTVAAPTAVTTSTRPLPVSSTGSNAMKNKPQPLSRSFPTTSPLATGLRIKDLSEECGTPAPSHGGLGVEDTDSPSQKKKKSSRRLWYNAFILILERGRPITRRVVVASRKPMETIPMETMERFGYEVRVLIRVPHGDGLDREQSKGKGSPSKVAHVEGISRSTSSERSSGRNASGAANNSLHGKTHVLGTPPNRVKYREQGVDELLQLKLYQAITDPEPDSIPSGSTIVLATGDGGPGQFAEQGFLGPIETTLRLGWNVELYAWEDSLSRAWQREFGANINSGKRGVFRIIGMNQFARWLAYDWA